MNVHFQVGPGHHDDNLFKGLINRKLDFSISRYFPGYTFEKYRQGLLEAQDQSRLFDILKWIIWGTTARMPWLRKNNRHLNLTYELYDKLTARRLTSQRTIFGWAQVSKASFEWMKAVGGTNILDCPIPHVRKWEHELQIESEVNLQSSARSQFSGQMMERMLDEIELADYISVPSTFVLNSFLENGVSEKKLLFNSYGIDTKLFSYRPKSEPTDRLKVIFVGSIELRKGVQYLLQAIRELDPTQVELWLLGTPQNDFKAVEGKFKMANNIKWLGQQSKSDVVKFLHEADVMVMPSILEGLSLTIIESMACGTPVISTTNTGGVDVIEDGVDGFIVPIRDVAMITKKLEWCIKERETLRQMGRNARLKIDTKYSQEHYWDRLLKVVLNSSHE